jgi:hypothetical protein
MAPFWRPKATEMAGKSSDPQTAVSLMRKINQKTSITAMQCVSQPDARSSISRGHRHASRCRSPLDHCPTPSSIDLSCSSPENETHSESPQANSKSPRMGIRALEMGASGRSGIRWIPCCYDRSPCRVQQSCYIQLEWSHPEHDSIYPVNGQQIVPSLLRSRGYWSVEVDLICTKISPTHLC